MASLVDTLSVSLDLHLGLLTPSSSLGSSAVSSLMVVSSDVAFLNTSLNCLTDTFHLANSAFASSNSVSSLHNAKSLASLVSSSASVVASGAPRTSDCNLLSNTFK